MNQSVWSKAMYASSSICFDGCPAEHLSSLQADPAPSNSDTSVNLQKDSENMNTLQDSSYYSSGDAEASLMCPSQLDSSTRQLSRRRHPSPAPASYEWNLSSGHQAKRARVENIIKGMTSSSPGICYTDATTTTTTTTNQDEETGCMQQGDPIKELPLLRETGMRQRQAARKQLERQHQHLRQLRMRFTQLDGELTDSSKEGKYPTWNESPETSPGDAFSDLYSDSESSSSRKYQGWKKVKLMNYFQSKPERIKLMADVLKYELSRAVSRSVDSIFKSIPLIQASPENAENAMSDAPLQSSVSTDDTFGLSCCGTADVQTEALSLVMQKPELERTNKSSRAHHVPKPPNPFSQDSALHENPASEKHNSTDHQHALMFLQDGHSHINQSKPEIFDTHWSSVKVRSKVNSRSVRSPHTHTMLLESLCLPHVKIESDNLVKNNMYMLNEGLTTNHLKKAKLMFFYTRYPSSLVLKMCFHDVQFTRCITSQLIKWFSNFREFYYIQMEKFARHALMEGVSDMRGLTVGRESELFRVLNMHYNKANDYQVPERFLEVAEVTLREFYVAISMGKDRDPSWKKAIYKVICKLDSDVPAEFKSHHTG